MADDYLSDREQEEALLRWWRENWLWILGGVVLAIAGVIGWNSYKSSQTRQAETAASVFQEFSAALGAQDDEKVQQLLQTLDGDYKRTPYAQHARMALARRHVEQGRLDEAAALLRSVVDDARDEELGWIARLRAARVLIELKRFDEAVQLLPVDSAGAFVAQARDVRGDALYAKGDVSGARAEYAAALSADEGQAGAAGTLTDRALVQMKLEDLGDASMNDAAQSGAAPVSDADEAAETPAGDAAVPVDESSETPAGDTPAQEQ